MKRYIKNNAAANNIPAPLDKWYDAVDDNWIRQNTDYFEGDIDGYPSELIDGYDAKHLGWAVAKDEYIDELMDDGLDIVEIVSEGGGAPFLGYVVNDRLYPVTESDMPEDWE